ncbi:MAG: DNA-binding protein WhiA [Clostridia bacterium]|nr:DNA-binding protein WhiA [Clostridia bacterium]
MSFSADVKMELAAIRPNKGCCLAAQCYGMLEFAHAYNGEEISLQTELKVVADTYSELIATCCSVPAPEVQSRPRRGEFYIAEVEERWARRRVLERFGHTDRDMSVRLNRANLDCDSCVAAVLRGAFLVCGAVSNPETGYHLEFSMPHYHLSRDLMTLLREMDFSAKYICRRGTHVIYLKESEQIADCLTLMGAQSASLEMLGIKVLKSIRNDVNRAANCETANIDKTVAAATAQIQAVRRLEEAGALKSLPESLQKLAHLRVQNPDMSLRELGENSDPPLSRSGVNHRLQRIMEAANHL